MASPQPTATTTTAPQQVTPARTGAIFGIVGAVLAIAGFFLPLTIESRPNISQPGSAFSTVSG